MKLQLLDAIGEITEARTAAGLWQQGQGCSLTGLSGAAKTVFLAALDRLLPEQGSLVFLLSGRDDIREYRRTLNCFYSDLLMQELYPVDLPLVQADSRNREIQAGRVAAMRILQGEERYRFCDCGSIAAEAADTAEGFGKRCCCNIGAAA